MRYELTESEIKLIGYLIEDEYQNSLYQIRNNPKATLLAEEHRKQLRLFDSIIKKLNITFRKE